MATKLRGGMTRFETLADLERAMERGEVPADVVSPSYCAAELNCTRQAIHERIKSGSLTAWGAERVVLISSDSLRKALDKQKLLKRLRYQRRQRELFDGGTA